MNIDKLIECLMINGKLDNNFGLVEEDSEEEDVVIDNSIKKVKRKDNQDKNSK